jgi:hypothetical protein
MERPRVQGAYGWAAFDRQHRSQNQKIDASSSDPFPPISGNTHIAPTSSVTRTNHSRMKSFSSVLRPCNPPDDSVKLLKDANPWADHGLIKDVLEGVNNDYNVASQILKSMNLNELEFGETIVSEETAQANVQKNKGLMQAAMTDENDSFINEMDNGEIFSVPIEPEWEGEDDVYFNHRKDALKMMRYDYASFLIYNVAPQTQKIS